MKQHEILKKYIIGLSKGYGNSLIVVSRAGLGKTETTMETMKELKLEEGKHYTYANNYITPRALVELLLRVNALQEPRMLVLDDIEDTLKNPESVGVLKGALWEVNGKRRVSWLTSKDELGFNFTGRIIFLLNYINKKSPVINALKDRGFYYEMDLTLSEMTALMEERAKLPYKDIPYNKRKEIVQFLQKVANNSPNITLRLLPKAYQLYQISPNHYQRLIKELL